MFNYIDIILIVLLLIFVIIGAHKGFIKSITSLFKGSVKIGIAFLLSKPLANLITRTRLGEHMFGFCKNWISSFSPNFDVNIAKMTDSSIRNAVNTAINSEGVPGLIKPFLHNYLNLTSEQVANLDYITLSEIAAKSFAYLFLVIISFILIFILISLLILILNKVSHRILTNTIILAKTERIFGAIVGLIKGLFVSCCIISILYLIRNIGFLNNITLKIQQSFLGKGIWNFIQTLFTKYINIKEIISNWVLSL